MMQIFRPKSKLFGMLICLVWIGLIFSFSLQPGDVSSLQSGRVVTLVKALFSFFQLDLPLQPTVWFVRKAAHFTEYFILGLLQGINKEKSKHFVMLTLLTPIIDESIQYFIPGRMLSVIDMAIDACGMFAGQAVIHLFRR